MTFKPEPVGAVNGPHQSGNGRLYYYVREKDSWTAIWRQCYDSDSEWIAAVRKRAEEAKREAAK